MVMTSLYAAMLSAAIRRWNCAFVRSCSSHSVRATTGRRGPVGDEAHLAQQGRRLDLRERLTLPVGAVLEDFHTPLQEEHEPARSVALVHERVPGGNLLTDRGLGELLDLLRRDAAPQQGVHGLSGVEGVHLSRSYDRRSR